MPISFHPVPVSYHGDGSEPSAGGDAIGRETGDGGARLHPRRAPRSAAGQRRPNYPGKDADYVDEQRRLFQASIT